jgi:hypothetical protein
VNRDAFDAAMRRMLDGYNVIGVFADPHFFESMIGAWESEYGRDMKVFARGQSSIMKFWTNNWGVDMYHATQNAHTGFEYDPSPWWMASRIRRASDCWPTRACRAFQERAAQG